MHVIRKYNAKPQSICIFFIFVLIRLLVCLYLYDDWVLYFYRVKLFFKIPFCLMISILNQSGLIIYVSQWNFPNENSIARHPSKPTDRCTDQNRRSDFSIEPTNIFGPYPHKTDRVTFSEAGFSPVRLKINSQFNRKIRPPILGQFLLGSWSARRSVDLLGQPSIAECLNLPAYLNNIP